MDIGPRLREEKDEMEAGRERRPVSKGLNEGLLLIGLLPKLGRRMSIPDRVSVGERVGDEGVGEVLMRIPCICEGKMPSSSGVFAVAVPGALDSSSSNMPFRPVFVVLAAGEKKGLVDGEDRIGSMMSGDEGGDLSNTGESIIASQSSQ